MIRAAEAHSNLTKWFQSIILSALWKLEEAS